MGLLSNAIDPIKFAYDSPSSPAQNTGGVVDIYGQGNRGIASSNPKLTAALNDAYSQYQKMMADEMAKGDGFPWLVSQQISPDLIAKAYEKAGLDPATAPKGADLGAYGSASRYNGVGADPAKLLELTAAVPGGDVAGVRDGIAYAAANNLDGNAAKQYAAKYAAEHQSNVPLNNLIKAGVGAMFAAGAGDAAGLWDLGAAPAVETVGAADAGQTLATLSPEAAGAYQTFTAPTALTGVSAAPELSAAALGAGGAGAGLLSSATLPAETIFMDGTAGSTLAGSSATIPAETIFMDGTAGSTLAGSTAGGAGNGLLSGAAAGGAGSTFIDGAAATGAGASNAATGAVLGGGGAGVSTPIVGSGALATGTVLGDAAAALGGAKNIATAVGGLLGAAAGGDTTTTSNKDPWGPAQQYLKDNLARNKSLQDQYAANPFNDLQKQAYQNFFDNSRNFQNVTAPGLMQFANQAMNSNYQRERPSAVGMAGYGSSNRAPVVQNNPFGMGGTTPINWGLLGVK